MLKQGAYVTREVVNKRADEVGHRKMLDELDIYAPDFSGTFIAEQLEVDVSKFAHIYLDSMNQQ